MAKCPHCDMSTSMCHDLVLGEHYLWYTKERMIKSERKLSQLEIVMAYTEFYNIALNMEHFNEHKVVLHKMTWLPPLCMLLKSYKEVVALSDNDVPAPVWV